jgi:ATP-dependent Lhr-like helicase
MDAAAGLAGFGDLTRDWFASAFEAPTPVQAEAWQAIRSGANALVIAPTGSGKTLAAFLQAIDWLAAGPVGKPPGGSGVKVLYVSPLKALAVDVERNLRVPLEGIRRLALERGLPPPDIRVGLRSGDTPGSERRRLVARPPDILITTPESLFLMLSSAAAETLRGVRTVIVDEVHAIAGTKRGAHLALSLERLESGRAGVPLQRIGLSATVRPPERVARFLAGTDRPCVIVNPPSAKLTELDIRVPVEDMTQLDTLPPLAPGPPPVTPAKAGVSTPAGSIWPHIDAAVLDLVLQHRSTI